MQQQPAPLAESGGGVPLVVRGTQPKASGRTNTKMERNGADTRSLQASVGKCSLRGAPQRCGLGNGRGARWPA